MVDSINKLLPSVRSQIPASVKIVTLYDRSVTIRESVNDVQFTLLLALGLVILVIFLFLRNLSATVIPSLALPMSIVGTFSVMYLLDYSLDNLSLMALILCVGFVVDDAIVVLENIVRHMEMGEAPFEAAINGSREIGFTILSMTLSLAAVFIPVFFLGGILGRLLHEFAVTIAAAILVSGFVSLTLTPMLCSRFLRPPREERHGRLYALTERFFQGMLHLYDRTLTGVLRHQGVTMIISVLLLVVTLFLLGIIPKGFLPSEDTGSVFTFTEAAQGISFDAMMKEQQELMAIVGKNPYVKNFFSSIGASRHSLAGNTGRIFIRLIPRNERPGVDEIIQQLRPQLAAVPGIRAFMQNLPPIRMGGMLDQEPVPVDPAEPGHQGPVPLCPPARGQDAHPAGAGGRDQRPADQKPPGQRGDQPGQGGHPGGHGPAGRGRPLLRLRLPADLHHLRPQQRIPGHHGAWSPATRRTPRPCSGSISAPARASWCPWTPWPP